MFDIVFQCGDHACQCDDVGSSGVSDIVFQCGDHVCQYNDVGSNGVSDIVFQCGDIHTNAMMLAAAVCLTLCFSVVTCIPMR